MERVFVELLNMSLTASLIVIAVIALRLIFRRVPKWIHCAMWALVAFRLICPLSFECDLSLMPHEKIISQSEENYGISQESEQEVTDSTEISLPETVGSTEQATPERSYEFHGERNLYKRSAKQNLIHVGMYVWLAGLAAIAAYGVISYVVLRRRLAEAVRLRDNIYQCDRICSPFMMGFVRPKIYLPFGMSEENMKYVIAHEQAHIKRHDNLTKIFGFAVTAMHWFNPMIWLAYILLCRDIELACDESVICGKSRDERMAYSMALLTCSTENSMKFYNAVPIAFGEVGVKQRVVNVVKNKKTAVWIICAVVAACLAVGVLLLTNRRSYSIEVSEKLDSAISQAILHDISNYGCVSNSDWWSECFGEGHIIYGVDENADNTKVYALYSYSDYIFINGNLVAHSGSSSIPTVIEFDVDDSGNYVYKDHSVAEDGSMYTDSVKKMFPKQIANKLLNVGEKEFEELNKQCHKDAQDYLKKIGREGKVGDYGDFDFEYLDSYSGISQNISEHLYEEFPEYNVNLMSIGTFERVENGIRFVYSINWDGDNQGNGTVEFRKYRYDTGEEVENFTYEISGDEFKGCGSIYDASNSTRLSHDDYKCFPETEIEKEKTYTGTDGRKYRYKLMLTSNVGGTHTMIVLANNKNLTYNDIFEYEISYCHTGDKPFCVLERIS